MENQIETQEGRKSLDLLTKMMMFVDSEVFTYVWDLRLPYLPS
jgi:hypothetical protein